MTETNPITQQFPVGAKVIFEIRGQGRRGVVVTPEISGRVSIRNGKTTWHAVPETVSISAVERAKFA